MNRFAFWVLFSLIAVHGIGQETNETDINLAKPLWKVLGRPMFHTLSGKLQITVFSQNDERNWQADLWADEKNARMQIMLPHPEGMRQFITILRPDGVWVLLPFAKQAIHHEGNKDFPWHNFWGIKTDKLELAKQNYYLRFIGKSIIAGHRCLGLEIIPKMKDNPVRKVYIHPKSRIPFMVQRLSPDGKLVFQVEFKEAQINQPLPIGIFDTTLPSDWKLRGMTLRKKLLAIADTERVLGFSVLPPTWLPSGYTLEGIFAMQVGQHKFAQLIYTDGISSISVFQHPLFGKVKAKVGWSPIQRMVPLHSVRREVNNLRIVLVSEVSGELLNKMAESIVFSVNANRTR